MLLRKKFLIVILSIILSSLILSFPILLKDKNQPAKLITSNLDEFNPKSEQERWQKRLNEVSPDTAYHEFKIEYHYKTPEIQHKAAHLFGGVLYQKAGIEGITVCDPQYAFGCYHSFFSKAIIDKGINVLIQLDQ